MLSPVTQVGFAVGWSIAVVAVVVGCAPRRCGGALKVLKGGMPSAHACSAAVGRHGKHLGFTLSLPTLPPLFLSALALGGGGAYKMPPTQA